MEKLRLEEGILLLLISSVIFANIDAQTAAIVFSEYICMAIMSFPWAYSVLGVIPGILLSILVSASVW